MIHSNIEEIVGEIIEKDEELKGKKINLHAIQSEVDNLAQKEEADLDDVVDRALVLLERAFGSTFMNTNKSAIEKDLRYNLRELEKK